MESRHVSVGAPRSEPAERGSALVIAILITVILTLLGVSFLFLGETENLIAQNETQAAQSLYSAEAGARAVKRWFDDPGTALHFPDPTQVERGLRQIRDDADPYGAPLGGSPAYKEGVDRNGDGEDDLFGWPYRGGPEHAFLGTSDGPDLRIDDRVPAQAAFLDTLSTTLFAGAPGGGLVTRIRRIDVSAPPYLREGATWARYGIATVRVVAGIYHAARPEDEPVAEHPIETVVAEVPYHTPIGPLHSCADTTWTGRLGVHWGTLSSVGRTVLSGLGSVPFSVPRALPPGPRLDPVWNTADAGVFAAFKTLIESPFPGGIPDPWFRVLSGGTIDGIGAPSDLQQPFPPLASPTGPDRSALLQLQPLVVCPPFDYALWRAIATSGEQGVEYFAWDGSAFRKDGTGPPGSFETLTRGKTGLLFFDTRDGLPPTDQDSDGEFDNLTPAIAVTGSWTFRGFLYLNSASFRLLVDEDPASYRTVNAPGEPYQDLDLDGTFDPGEGYLNLISPGSAAQINAAFVGDVDDPGTPVRDERGPDIPDVPVALQGILYTSGRFEATGRGRVYGSVIARQGVSQSPADGSAETPDLYWDETIVSDWPPPGWHLPRVTATAWNLEGRLEP